jgi:hypothetical protein
VSWLTAGADVGTMVTGVSAATAAYVWARNQIRDRQQEKAARAARNWNGFIMLEGIGTWYVRLIPDGTGPIERITLDVINPDGTVNPQMAHFMRQVIEGDGMLSRAPSPEQMAFLQDLRKHRFGTASGYPVQ